jgi:aminoglycoside/choline kinase family phosphotransferase
MATESFVLKVLDVDGAVRRVKGGWIGTGVPWEYDEARYRKLDEARKREQQAMLDYQVTEGCRMAFLRGQLDDPELAEGERCGRCDNCTGKQYDASVDPSSAEDTRQRLMRPGVEVSPRKQWPSGLAKLGVSLSGKIGDGPAPGRVIGRLTDLGWGARLRRLLDEPDAEVPAEVVQAAVKVLAKMHAGDAPAQLSSDKPLFDFDLVAQSAETDLLTEWFMPLALGRKATDEEVAEHRRLWRAALEGLGGRRVFIHRDFHAENLLWLPERQGVARVGLIDFQDAVAGSPAYDLISLTKDARRTVSPELAEATTRQYLAAMMAQGTPLDEASFRHEIAVMAAQRTVKIVGIFARLHSRDGKPRYLPFLPRLWTYLDRDLAHPALHDLRTWYDRTIPKDKRAVNI